MSDIEWKEDFVCYAEGRQWTLDTGLLTDCRGNLMNLSGSLEFKDFQLNEPLQGDCIVLDELEDEDEYNNVVDVFMLFGFPRYEGASFEDTKMNKWLVVDKDKDLIGTDYLTSDCKRMVSYKQLMAIGKLKHLIDERKDSLSGHFIGLEKAIHSCDFDNIVFHSDKILDFNSNITKGDERDTKASKAYNLLKSMDIHYDEEQKLWYKKEFL